MKFSEAKPRTRIVTRRGKKHGTILDVFPETSTGRLKWFAIIAFDNPTSDDKKYPSRWINELSREPVPPETIVSETFDAFARFTG